MSNGEVERRERESRNLERWEREFRSAAKAAGYAAFRDHLRKLDLPDKPKLLLEGTIRAVQACVVYASIIDGQSSAGFLAMQKYASAEVADAKYAFTFDLGGKAFARVLVSAKFEFLDLADLYAFGWWEYKVCGYHRFWVSRADGRDLSGEELAQIERQVTYDLRYDYSEDELDFWFDDSSREGVLEVTVQDRDAPGEEDEDGNQEHPTSGCCGRPEPAI